MWEGVQVFVIEKETMWLSRDNDGHEKLCGVFLNYMYLHRSHYASAYVCAPHTQAMQFLWQWHQRCQCCQMLPPQTAHWRKFEKKLSPLQIGSPTNFCCLDQKKEKNRTKEKQANIPFKAGRTMLFSLQRKDLLLWSLRQEGHITVPHQHCRQVSSRPCGFFPRSFLICPERSWIG